MSAINTHSGFSRAVQLDSTTAERLLSLPALLNQYGVNLRSDGAGISALPGPEPSLEVVGEMAGTDDRNKLNLLTNGVSNLRVLGWRINAAIFGERMAPLLPDTKPVKAALERHLCGSLTTSMDPLVDLIIKFYRKDIKHPIRNLKTTVVSVTWGLSVPATLPFSETIGTLGEAKVGMTRRHGVATVVEDTPVVRRYIQYLNHLAQRQGLLVLWAPTSFATDPIEQSVNIEVRGGEDSSGNRVRINNTERQHRALTVFLFGDYERFHGISRYEFAQQPGQGFPSDAEMCYIPLFNECVVQVATALSTLGAFSPCKIFYKNFRQQVSSQPVDPSPSGSSTTGSEQIPF